MVGTLFKPLSHICFFSLQHSYVLARNETHDPNAGHLRNIAELTHDHLSACGFRGFHDSFGCKNPWKAKFAIFLEVLLHDMKVSILLHLPPRPDVRGCRAGGSEDCATNRNVHIFQCFKYCFHLLLVDASR